MEYTTLTTRYESIASREFPSQFAPDVSGTEVGRVVRGVREGRIEAHLLSRGTIFDIEADSGLLTRPRYRRGLFGVAIQYVGRRWCAGLSPSRFATRAIATSSRCRRRDVGIAAHVRIYRPTVRVLEIALSNHRFADPEIAAARRNRRPTLWRP